MKKITVLMTLVVAGMILSGCASTYNSMAKGWNNIPGSRSLDIPLMDDDTNTLFLSCSDSKAVYYENLDKKKQVRMSLKNEVLIGENIDNATYYMHPGVMLLIEQTTFRDTKRTNVYLIDDATRTSDGMNYGSLYNSNKALYSRICGSEKLTKISLSEPKIMLSAARSLAYRVNKPVKTQYDMTVENALNRSGVSASDEDEFKRDYPKFPAYQAILKKHIPGYSDDAVHVADPVAVLNHFVNNKAAQAALDADLATYFSGKYFEDVAGVEAKKKEVEKAKQERRDKYENDQAKMQEKINANRELRKSKINQ